MESLVLTVSQLNNYIKGLFDEIPVFRNIYVSGEISNFTNHYRTGHFYFSLKDEKAVVKAVMFNSYASKVKFEPENGMLVLVKARLSVFERDGVYQLYVEDIQPKGLGGLNLAFEQLKNKLEAQGLFDESLKKPIPKYPAVIGVITSPTGAAVRDIKNVLSRRYPVAEVKLEPVIVQGDSAPKQIISALEKLNSLNNCDVIILARGGGSIEDLWAFNSEDVALAIAKSEIPVITGIGHETDFTIADFVADLRAPTPSAAAEIAVPDMSEVKAHINELKVNLRSSLLNRISREKLELESLKSRTGLKNIKYILDEQKMLLASLSDKCEKAYSDKLAATRINLANNIARLDSLSPLKVLSRGYSVVKKVEMAITKSEQILPNDTIDIQFSEGSAKCTVLETFGGKNE